MHLVVNLLLQEDLVDDVVLCRLLVVIRLQPLTILSFLMTNGTDMADETRLEVVLIQIFIVEGVNTLVIINGVELSHLFLHLTDEVRTSLS